MLQVYIWGAGYYAQQVIDEINDAKVIILGILDCDKKKQGTELFCPIPVISPLDILEKDFDYLIISVKNYEPIENECRNLGIATEKIIVYWEEWFDNRILKKRAERIDELLREKQVFQCRLNSAPYEWGIKQTPKIIGGSELLGKIVKDHTSLCRFGDGEFDLIRGKKHPWFQKADVVLGKRLKEILLSEDDSINIAIAQNFIGLERYKEEAADSIRKYMFGETREYILDLLDEKRIYYDAYVTRPYIIYRDKNNAEQIFHRFKKLWTEKNVVIIEGEYSRFGVGNDLLEHACCVSRILCPSENAWDKYEAIMDIVLKKISKESLILISLGPCATVLAYDLAKEGYQTLDIGQLDNEYEWYLRGVERRVRIPGKVVAELTMEQELELPDMTDYERQIITKII